MCFCLSAMWGVYNFGLWGYLWESVGVVCVCVHYDSVSSPHPPAGVNHFLYVRVNDLAVQSHSPVRAPSPTATGGLGNWYPTERKSKGRKRWEDEGCRESERSRLDHQRVVSPKYS